MASIEKIKDGIILECDCELIHKIKVDAEGNIKIKTSGRMKKEEPADTKPADTKPEDLKKENEDNFLKLF